MPLEVRTAVTKFAQRWGIDPSRLLGELEYSNIMGCWYFTWDGVFYGVEANGYLHS